MCRRPAVRALGVLALGLMILGADSALYAIPVVRLTGGGGHTTDVTASDCTLLGGPSSNVCLVLFNPADLLALDANGLGSLGIKNDLAQTITALDFVLPNNNFNQGFIASTIADTLGQTTIFTTAQLVFAPFPGLVTLGVTGGGGLVPTAGTVEPAVNVIFSGTGTGSGMTTGPTNPCMGPFKALFSCPANGPSGFDGESLKPDTAFPSGEGYLVVTFGPPAANCTLCGLGSGAEATFSATTAVPEPGLFPLSLLAMGALVTVRQKIYRR